jgi:hypothetical protein
MVHKQKFPKHDDRWQVEFDRLSEPYQHVKFFKTKKNALGWTKKNLAETDIISIRLINPSERR